MPRKRRPTAPSPNRTDRLAPVQPIRAAPGQEYGAATQQRQAQQVQPLPTDTLNQAMQHAAGLNPQPLAPLDQSLNPNEHPMTGAPAGPGAGPDALPPWAQQTPSATGPPTPADPGVDALRALYHQHANSPWAESLRRLLEEADQ